MYEDSPEDLCADNLYAGVWQGDMLGSNILGERKTVSSLTVDDLRAHMRRYYTSERMVAAVCGRFDREEIVRLCEKFFGPMTNSGNPVQASPAQYRKCLTLRKKDFEQTQLALAMPGIGAQDDRRFAMRLLMSVLGTSSSSRLYQRIREELGLVYEIESFSASYLGRESSALIWRFHRAMKKRRCGRFSVLSTVLPRRSRSENLPVPRSNISQGSL